VFPRDHRDRPIIVADGRVLGPSAYRPSAFAELEDTVAWWSALAVLGGLVLVAGVLVGSGRGEVVAISGVALFFATAVLAGAERTELATALGVAGVVWTSAGISLALGTDPSWAGSLVGLAALGGLGLLTGFVGALRANSRSKPILNPAG
jgi:hypothetical protein